MQDIIDLTVDPPSRKADDGSESKQARRERRREARRAKEEENGNGEEKDTTDRKRKRDEDEDSRNRRRDSRRSRRESSSDPDRKHNRRKKDRDRDRDGAPEREPSPPIPNEQLFFIDETPAPLPTAALYAPAASASQKPDELVLPAHVSVFGETPIDIPAAALELDSEGEDYIEYLDYDNRKDFVRYYDNKPEERRIKTVCKKCGAEDEHTTAECHVLICLTCGAREEHSTRSCNIGKTCFSCGMKGHINIDCPTRYSSRPRNYDGCERCNSLSHQTSECPMIWRLYVYVEDAEQERIIQARKAKKGVPLGQGGEGYIADDEWCYNCGGSGHWGDDCREFYHPDPIVEPTAFSHYFLSAGPFTAPFGSSAPLRDWEQPAVALPGDVGRRARKKEMEKLGRRAQQQEEEEPDWFQNSRNGKNRERERERPAGNPPTGPRKMNFGQSLKGAGLPVRPTFQISAPSSSKVALSDRLSDPVPDRHHDTKASSRRERDRAADSNSRHRERDKDRHRDERQRGPRYKGGYSR